MVESGQAQRLTKKGINTRSSKMLIRSKLTEIIYYGRNNSVILSYLGYMFGQDQKYIGFLCNKITHKLVFTYTTTDHPNIKNQKYT